MNFGEFVWKGRLSNKNTKSQKQLLMVSLLSITFNSLIRIFAQMAQVADMFQLHN